MARYILTFCVMAALTAQSLQDNRQEIVHGNQRTLQSHSANSRPLFGGQERRMNQRGEQGHHMEGDRDHMGSSGHHMGPHGHRMSGHGHRMDSQEHHRGPHGHRMGGHGHHMGERGHHMGGHGHHMGGHGHHMSEHLGHSEHPMDYRGSRTGLSELRKYATLHHILFHPAAGSTAHTGRPTQSDLQRLSENLRDRAHLFNTHRQLHPGNQREGIHVHHLGSNSHDHTGHRRGGMGPRYSAA